MARWVIPEYENRIAALFVVVSALLPWEVSRVLGGAILHVRWPLVELYRRTAVQPVTRLRTPVGAYASQVGGGGPSPLATAYVVWMLMAAVFAVTLAFVAVLYLREGRVVEACRERLNRRPATVLGWLLVANGVGFLATSVAIVVLGATRLSLPVGSLFMLLFGAVLLTNDPPE